MAPSTQLLSLPDDVLAHIFEEGLTLLERHQALPLTCRRLNRVVNAPQLLRTVDFDSSIKFDYSTDDKARAGTYLPRARSFACWAVRHAAGAVQRLVLRLNAPNYSAHKEADAIWIEMLGALGACGAAGSLQEARLSLPFCSASLPAWLPVMLRSVQLLHLDVEDGGLAVAVPLTGMAALSDLRLDAMGDNAGLSLAPTASLPPTLKRLHLGGMWWGDEPVEDVPPQIAGLPALRCLRFEYCAFTQEGLEALSQLAGSLEELYIEYCFWPSPATLACLTRLTSLDAHNFIGDREEPMDDVPQMLEETLAALPQLRALRVSFYGSAFNFAIPAPTRLLTALQHLQHLVWDITLRSNLALPPGIWLTGLLSVALPGDMVTHNTAALASAQQLQHLVALEPRDQVFLERPPADASWRLCTVQWAASHPTLRRLDIEAWAAPGADFEQAKAAAEQQNSALQVCTSNRLAQETLEQFMQRGGFLPA